MSHTPFTKEKQEKFKELYKKQLSASSQTKSEDIINWLETYVVDEQFNDTDTIIQDLTDPQYSAIKSAMQSQFKWDNRMTQRIIDILLNDIFIAPHRNHNNSTSITINEEEETKVFYPTEYRRESCNELANAFIEALGGSVEENELFTPRKEIDRNNSYEDLELSDHIREITPNPDSFIESKSNTQDIPPPAGAYFTDLSLLRNPGPPPLSRHKTTHKEEDVIEDEGIDDDFPVHLNVALFHRSDDESLELLIDKAVLAIFYGEKFKQLWTKRRFIESIYSDKSFPSAVDKVFNKIDDCDNHNDDNNNKGFIGSFVDKHFKRQINEYKRQIETGTNDNICDDNIGVSQASMSNIGGCWHESDEKRQSEKYFVYFHENVYIIQTKKSYGEKLMTLEAKENVNYSWAVWKVLTKIRNENIRSKGYWEVIEKEEDEKRSKKILKELRVNAPGLFKLKSSGFSSKVLAVPSSLKVIKQTLYTSSVSISNKPPLFRDIAGAVGGEKKKSKFLYIPLVHLQLIFELMQFHYHWSIQSDIMKKDFEKQHQNLLETPFYVRYCSKNEYPPIKQADRLIIDGILYTLVWWNGVGQRKCNAFCVQIGSEAREYYYLRFKNDYPKFRWDWYDNDKSKYQKYSRGDNHCVYKELEASFQGNIDENFPEKVFFKSDALYRQNENKHMFNICILPKLKKTLQRESKAKSQKDFVLRFTFNPKKKNRIINIEQLSIQKNQQPFPRNVRRLIDHKNTIYFYFQSTDEYIEEWKKRYKLSTDQQQKYFFSFILCICAVMKYIQYEFSHQMISFPFKKSFGNEEGVFGACLDDSDVQRHRRDFELWSGFFIPPEHQFLTSQVDKNNIEQKKNKRKKKSKKADVKAWYKSLAIVEPLKKFIYERDRKNKEQQLLLDSTQNVVCNHSAGENDILWLCNSTQYVYCDRCGVLLQFSECIRKYVLETENNELIDFLWPWYRNYFHRRDVKKYHTSVAKYNLTYLFRIEDVLNKDEKKKQDEDISCKDNCCFCCVSSNKNNNNNMKANKNKYDDIDDKYDDVEENKCDDKNKNKTERSQRTQIRHFRKFAAHVMLGGWDILRNLNIIRNQLQCIFVHFKEQESKEQEQTQTLTWHDWQEIICECNEELRSDLNNSKARKLMELHHEDQLSMKSNDQGIFSSLIGTILNHSNLYHIDKDTIIDGFNNDSLSDLKLDDKSDDNGSFTSSMAPDSDKLAYYIAFKQSWRMVPDWWFYQHDKLLLELALKFNWDRHQYKTELTHPRKKQYYQVLLTKKELIDADDGEHKALSDYSLSLEEEDMNNIHDDDDDDDDFDGQFSPHNTIRLLDDGYGYEGEYCQEEDEDYIGYQEFQVWCENWRNIQHRLRYLTFVICDYFNHCTPSMVEIRIPDERHRIEQYKSKSIVFLNGYMEHVHILNCKEEAIDLNNIQERNNKLKQIEVELLNTSTCTPATATAVTAAGRNSMVFSPLLQLGKETKSSAYNAVLNDGRARKVIHGNSSKRLQATRSSRYRIRDPFMKRDLDFELEQICQSFDTMQYGTEIASFIIVLLKRKQLDALWSALGIVLEHMPFESARAILETYQEDLRHGQPQQLKTVCDRIIKGSNFSVHIALFLAEYMENNSAADLARYDEWMKYSKAYESEAGATINTIESNHLLAVLLDIPLTYSGGSKVSLLQVALEQNRAEFLNNERINAVMAHVWQSPSGLAPNKEIQQATNSYFDIWWMLFDKPYHFYLTPMGFNATIKTLHLLYLLLIFLFISQRQYLDNDIEIYEQFLWTLNIGYILYECIEAYDKGIRGYLSLAGWINWWDIQICITWIILFSIRMVSISTNYNITHQDLIFEIYMMLWAMQTASLSARALVLFQTSEYFGVLLRMLLRLMAEMLKFMFVLGLLLVGFVFGLYYIQGGYIYQEEAMDHNLGDWYAGFKYLFQLTVGAGDFSELEDIANEVTAQIFVIGYLILAAILMMNLLIALLTTTYETIHMSAKTASSFAFAESTYDLSHRSRFMPAPICIYIFAISMLIHILNFIPAIIHPKYLNIYNCITHHQYEGFDAWRMTYNGCLNCKKIYVNCCLAPANCKKKWVSKQDTLKRLKYAPNNSQLLGELHDREERKKSERFFLCCNCKCCKCCYCNSIELEVQQNDNCKNNNKNKEKTYELTTRGRVCKYYLSTFCWGCFETFCDEYLKSHRFDIYHTGCYSCIPTSLGAKEKIKDRSLVNGISLNQYAELYEKYHQFNLDQADIVLLKHLTVDSLFCKICYRPFDPKALNQVLLTPFWALSEIISIYAFPLILWLPLCCIYGLFTLIEMLQSCLNEEGERENVDDYDRQYFAREALTVQNKWNKKNKKNQKYDSDSSSSDESDS